MANELKIDKSILENEEKIILAYLNDMDKKNKELLALLESTAEKFEGESAKVFCANNLKTVLSFQSQSEAVKIALNLLLEYCDEIIKTDNDLKAIYDGVGN